MGSQSRGEKPAVMEPCVGEFELSFTWKNLNQSKAALRHIENQLEVGSGSGVIIASLNTERTHKYKRRGRLSSDGEDAVVKPCPQSRCSPDKSYRSPLGTSTQDNTHTSDRLVSPLPGASLTHLVNEHHPLHSANADATRSSTTTICVNDDSPAVQRSEVTVGLSEASPGSARLEKLRQRQTDEKLEKLKERIRRQREHSEEASNQQKGIMIGMGKGNGAHQCITKMRKVAAAPPAPNYKGFNNSEMQIRSSDGKVWEDEFHVTSEIHKERMRRKPSEKDKQHPEERNPTKPVRKIYRSTSIPEPKQAISASSWRDGQKLVKMILGPLPRDICAQSEERERQTGTACLSSSVPRSDVNHSSRPNSTEKHAVTQPSRAAGSARGKEHPQHRSSRPPGGNRERETILTQTSRQAGAAVSLPSSLDLLSADIRGILDDLHLEDSGRSHDKGQVSRRRVGRNPSKQRPESSERVLLRKRHYDTEAVRRYITKQQEERKRKQVEERRNLRDEQERRSQRLQELYKKQREGVAKQQLPPPNLINPSMKDTYTKILLEHTLQRAWPGYQPSGESDKENKRLEPVSPSTSELSEHTPSPLCSMEPEHVNSTTHLRDPYIMNASQRRTGHVDISIMSRQDRVEALKAHANSLSSRVESEARKLVTSTGIHDNSGHAHRAKQPSPPEREHPDASSRIHNDVIDLPGVRNLYSFLTREGWAEIAEPCPLLAGPSVPFRTLEEKQHDSSGGSISEGVLSDSSLSDHTNHCEAHLERPVHNRITLFQKHAELHSPSRPVVTEQPPWEELSKGSPHSVINVFAKNMNKFSNEVERLSPAGPLSPSAHSFLSGVANEDDFVSYRSSQSASKKTDYGISNGQSSVPVNEKREHDGDPHSSVSAPLSSPSSTHSISKRGSLKSLDRTLVDGQRSSFSELHRKGDSPRGSLRGSDCNCTPGSYSVASEILQFTRSPSDSPRVSASTFSSPQSARNSTPRVGTAPYIAPNSESARNLVSDAGPAHSTTELHFAPVMLQQCLSAELSFLDVVEESVRQLSDVERVRAVSLAQQETVSLAHIIKAQQQRQERELQLLKLKAEQEALETQRHIEDSRERAAQAHAELCVNLVQSHQKALVELQENSSKMLHQQTETAQHLREMTEMTHSQLINVPSVSSVRQPLSDRSEISAEKPPAADIQSSLSESSSIHSLSVRQDDGGRGGRNSLVKKEENFATDDSLQTDKVDSVSIHYSLKFDESVTEDELEKSFRSVLPSESHWRGSVERKRHESRSEKSSSKDGGVPVFSADQDSFSEFTMAMVKQCMQEEEVRSQHQSSLLRLRHRALKEKTRAELDWLELQKRQLRDKGEDDKMPPIRKKQRGLLLRLQQEQAEIRRLQEVNRAARRERKLLLKQQEEIERIQHTTLKLREKLRIAEDTNQRSPVSGMSEDLAPPIDLDVEFRTPSPLSMSGSETSSIMKKLKKMSYHTDERFLTQRELRLVHWRQHVEAELRRTDGSEPRRKGQELPDQPTDELKRDRREDRKTGPEVRSEGESSSAQSISSIHTVQECENTHSHEPSLVHVSSSSKVISHSSSRKRDLPSSAPTSEAASDQSDIEGRVLALRAELRRRKAEVQRLKKEQKQRHKERLKAQEASLLKQLESYNEIIEKTRAELREADRTTSTKPQIRTPTSVSHKSRTSTPDGSETEKSFKGRSLESEKSEQIHTESPPLSDEDPPTVTPTPVSGSPNHLSSPEPWHGELSSTKPETDASANQSVVSSSRSAVIEELESLRSNWVQSETSYPELKVKIQDSNEVFSKNEPELALAVKVNHEEVNNFGNQSEDVKSSSLLITKSHPEEPKSPEIPLPIDISSIPDIFPSRMDDSEHKATVSSSFNSYNRYVESVGQEENQPHSSEVPEEESYKFSLNDNEEELNLKSGNTSTAFEQERPSDLNLLANHTEEHVGDIPSTSKSLKDEMSDYTIGDRVLVSNIQPGTLRFKGRTSFTNDIWAGVELDASEGSNDGTYDGVVYFHCKEKHGIFAPPEVISHQPEALEIHTSTSEEEDSSFDDQSNGQKKVSKSEGTLLNKKTDHDQSSETEESPENHPDLDSKTSHISKDLKIQPDDGNNEIFQELTRENVPVSLDGFGDIILECKAVSKVKEVRDNKTPDILGLLYQGEVSMPTEDHQKSLNVPLEKVSPGCVYGSVMAESDSLATLADTLMERFMGDALKQFQQIKKAKEEKVSAANQLISLDDDEEPSMNNVFQLGTSSSAKIDKETLNIIFDKDREEVSSPELCTRLESPVLGQEELVKRLAELELNREFLHVLGDEQDWFDEDFGLSSRKHTQHKNKLQQEDLVSPSAAKLPHIKQQEDMTAATMLVPHTADEVEKLVSTSLLAVWRSCRLESGNQRLTAVPKPLASETLLGENNGEQCVRSYKQAVYDLTWELMQEIYAEDPNANCPPWIKPRRFNSPYSHRINNPTDLSTVQVFVNGEVLKLLGLNKEQNHKTDWQKMLKFGRKKRDRVDHILVQELHEEESLWVNYDDDELLVKMQLADGILDTLLKDTVDVLTNIHHRRSTWALS